MEEPKKRAKWRDGDKWNKVIGIPLSDCINACGQMERAVIFPKPGDKAASKDTNCVAFGKYKGKSYEWIADHDAGYYDWCCENIKGFQKEAEKYIK